MAAPPTTERTGPDPRHQVPGRLTGMTIFRLPEFRAFCDKVGIAWQLPTRRLVIEIPCQPEDCVKITQEYLTPRVAVESEPDGFEVAKIETTTQHNEQFRTFQPGTRPDRAA